MEEGGRAMSPADTLGVENSTTFVALTAAWPQCGTEAGSLTDSHTLITSLCAFSFTR